VSLAGEAVFTVAHDSVHPFVVRAGHALIQDAGTRFDVRAYADDRPVRVVVAEGSVKVRAGSQDRAVHRLGRGELGQLDSDGTIVTRTVDPAPYLDWAQGRLSFDAVPMRDVAQQLALWYGTPVVVADSALAARDFSGTFTGQSLHGVLAVVAAAVHARVAWRGDTARLSSRPDSQ
jgi:ferric-dicitrate binding protein FerR (iron transport regulator)